MLSEKKISKTSGIQIEEEIWQKFIADCKKKGLKISFVLGELIEKFVNK